MIEITEIKDKLGNGCTVPYLCWCSDGKTYVVKFPGNPQSKRALVNEFICSRICEILKLPIMDYKLISVKKENYKECMKNDGIDLIPGIAFGTVYNDRLLIVLNSGHILKSINYYDAIKILIFDMLIGNFDRNNGNLMIDSITKKLIMIDHTHVFNLGTIWDSIQLKYYIEEEFDMNSMHMFGRSILTNGIKYDEKTYDELNIFIKNVKNINESVISDIMNSIPDDWEVSKQEKDCLLEYLITRFKRIDEIISYLNLKGGGVCE